MVEVTLAILLIMGTVLIVFRKDIGAESGLEGVGEIILEEIAMNLSLREKAYNGNAPALESYVGGRIAIGSVDFDIIICSMSQDCVRIKPTNREVYVSQRIISAIPMSTLYEPKKIKLFMWKK